MVLDQGLRELPVAPADLTPVRLQLDATGAPLAKRLSV
jgi:hypothetical protein